MLKNFYNYASNRAKALLPHIPNNLSQVETHFPAGTLPVLCPNLGQFRYLLYQSNNLFSCFCNAFSILDNFVLHP